MAVGCPPRAGTCVETHSPATTKHSRLGARLARARVLKHAALSDIVLRLECPPRAGTCVETRVTDGYCAGDDVPASRGHVC